MTLEKFTRDFSWLLCASVFFVQVSAAETSVPFDSDKWDIQAKESKVEEYLGEKSLFLQDGFAIIKDSDFTDGIIEYDVAFPRQRGFIGSIWRWQNPKNYEEFYMRPHQSGNPDANQYSPVFNGLDAWQLYYGEGYGAPVRYAFDEWMHIKIMVSGKNAEIYIRDMDKPALIVRDMKREIRSGKLGLKGDLAPAHFANFSYVRMENPPLRGKISATGDTPAGTIMSWQVSDSFDEKSLSGKLVLTEDDKKKLSWKKLTCESTGMANLSKVQASEKDKNCVFARTSIISDKDQIKSLQFGFSDRIKVYFNDELIYSGNDTYGSRDYRFLGTMGFFDTLYLHLKKGENKLWVAVAESFGGWGIQAAFTDAKGISIKE